MTVRAQKWLDRENAFTGLQLARMLGQRKADDLGYASIFAPASCHAPVTEAQYQLLLSAGLGMGKEALLEAYSSDEEGGADGSDGVDMEEKHADSPAAAAASKPAYRIPKRLMWRSALADTALHNLDRFAYKAVLKPGERRYRLPLPEEADIAERQQQEPERYTSVRRMPSDTTLLQAFMLSLREQA